MTRCQIPDTRRAARAFEEFTGRKPRHVKASRLAGQDVVGWGMGPVVGIAYEAVRDGQKSRYFHEFDKSSRPDLVASDDGRQLYITGGQYRVTDRGIEDMPELFVVNPSPRRGKKMAAKRNARGRFVKSTRKASRRRRMGGARQVAVFSANPAPKRRKRRSGAARPAARRRVFRRNPSGGGMLGQFSKLAMPAAGIGVGAVGSELVMGYLPLPSAWKQGVARHITKGGVGLAAGWTLAKVFKQRKLGTYFALGAIAIATHDAIKEFIAARIPALPRSGFGEYGQYVGPLPSQFNGMGYINPGATVSFGEYVAPLPSQFGGASQAYASPGGETSYVP